MQFNNKFVYVLYLKLCKHSVILVSYLCASV